jgi:hypothetical protein
MATILEKDASPTEKRRSRPLIRLSLPKLHNSESGRVDAREVADFIGVPLKPFAEGIGLNYKAVHRNPSAAAFQNALRPVKRSLEILSDFFVQPKRVRAWLNTSHPDLDGRTAIEVILEGKSFAVLRILEDAAAGVPV